MIRQKNEHFITTKILARHDGKSLSVYSTWSQSQCVVTVQSYWQRLNVLTAKNSFVQNVLSSFITEAKGPVMHSDLYMTIMAREKIMTESHGKHLYQRQSFESEMNEMVKYHTTYKS